MTVAATPYGDKPASRPAAALRLLLAFTLGAACAAPVAQPVVLISGRDDHGLLERPVLGLQRSPDDRTVVATVRDGSFARIVRTQGPWHYLRTVEPTPQEGWLEDHYLRTAAVHTERQVQVAFIDAAVRYGQVLIQVRPRTGGDAEWVAATALKEIGARER